MGICDSKKEIKTFPGNHETEKTNINNNTDKHNSFSEKSINYIIPQRLCIRDDIEKYYHLTQKILGKGVSGHVYIGQKNGKNYAIKRISKTNLSHVALLLTEADISMQLKHENIMTYYEIFEDSQFISYVMDLGEGGDLFDFISGCPLGHLPADIILELLIQIFNVIDYLHNEKKITHRDLKPENFLIKIDNNNKPQIKLIDFGMAAYIQNNYKFKVFLGTRAYAAPEIFSRSGYNEKIDEWAVGVILYNMLTGYEPFEGDTKSELIDSICNQEINFDIIKDVDLKELDKKLLDRDYNKRITAKEALKNVLALKFERDSYFKGISKMRKMRKTPSFILKQEFEENELYNKYWETVKNEINRGGVTA